MMAEKEEHLGLTETGDQESRVQDIQECKQDKRNAKRHMTRLLNKLAAMLSEDDEIPKTEIKDMLPKIEEQQDHTIMAIDRLESFYRQKKEEALADKVSDEVDDLLEQIDLETRPARLILASRTKVKSRPASVADSEASLRRREKEKAEQEARLRRDQLEWEIEQNREQIQRQEQELHAVNQELNKRRRSLRTVPVILKNGNRRVFVNCLFDEGSDTTYVNEDVINEIELTGKKEPITGNVANDQTIHFMSGTFEIGLESTDGRVDTKIIAKTSNKICGGLKAVNWVNIQDRWNHLRGIPFPRLAKRNRIDVLLGADHHELMYSMKEVSGAPNEPCARLCPLGWTAIGKIQLDTKDTHYTGFHYTFRLQIEKREPTFTLPEKDTAELNCLLKRFWDLESIGNTSSGQQHLTPEDKLAWTKVNNSLKFGGQHYEGAVPWRDERPQLPNNLPMAKKRLVSTERKLMKDKEVAVAYQQVLKDYLDKKYIRRVPDDEPMPECQWPLPHFPVVRPEKATSKVRIVFDGSAHFEGKSLNTEAIRRYDH